MSYSVKQQMKRSRRKASTFWDRLANPDPHRVDNSVFWCWLCVLAFGVLSFGAVEPWALATFKVGTAVLSVLWVVSGMYRRLLSVSLVPLFIPAVLFLALIGEQLVTGRTAYRFATENSMFLYLTYGALVFVGVQVLNSDRRFRDFGLVAAAFGIGLAVLAILQNLTSPREIYWSIYPEFGNGVFGPYVNHSHYAGLMEMLIPLPFVIGAARLLPRSWRPICFGAGAVMAGSVFLSGSRGGIIAVVVQLCLLYFFLRGRFQHRDHSASKRRLSLTIASSMAALALILWLGGQEMIGRISSMKDPYGSSVGATRILIARD